MSILGDLDLSKLTSLSTTDQIIVLQNRIAQLQATTELSGSADQSAAVVFNRQIEQARMYIQSHLHTMVAPPAPLLPLSDPTAHSRGTQPVVSLATLQELHIKQCNDNHDTIFGALATILSTLRRALPPDGIYDLSSIHSNPTLQQRSGPPPINIKMRTASLTNPPLTPTASPETNGRVYDTHSSTPTNERSRALSRKEKDGALTPTPSNVHSVVGASSNLHIHQAGVGSGSNLQHSSSMVSSSSCGSGIDNSHPSAGPFLGNNPGLNISTHQPTHHIHYVGTPTNAERVINATPTVVIPAQMPPQTLKMEPVQFEASTTNSTIYFVDHNNICYLQSKSAQAYRGHHPLESNPPEAVLVDQRPPQLLHSGPPMASSIQYLNLAPAQLANIHHVHSSQITSDASLIGFAVKQHLTGGPSHYNLYPSNELFPASSSVSSTSLQPLSSPLHQGSQRTLKDSVTSTITTASTTPAASSHLPPATSEPSVSNTRPMSIYPGQPQGFSSYVEQPRQSVAVNTNGGIVNDRSTLVASTSCSHTPHMPHSLSGHNFCPPNNGYHPHVSTWYAIQTNNGSHLGSTHSLPQGNSLQHTPLTTPTPGVGGSFVGNASHSTTTNTSLDHQNVPLHSTSINIPPTSVATSTMKSDSVRFVITTVVSMPPAQKTSIGGITQPVPSGVLNISNSGITGFGGNFLTTERRATFKTNREKDEGSSSISPSNDIPFVNAMFSTQCSTPYPEHYLAAFSLVKYGANQPSGFDTILTHRHGQSDVGNIPSSDNIGRINTIVESPTITPSQHLQLTLPPHATNRDNSNNNNNTNNNNTPVKPVSATTSAPAQIQPPQPLQLPQKIQKLFPLEDYHDPFFDPRAAVYSQTHNIRFVSQFTVYIDGQDVQRTFAKCTSMHNRFDVYGALCALIINKAHAELHGVMMEYLFGVYQYLHTARQNETFYTVNALNNSLLAYDISRASSLVKSTAQPNCLERFRGTLPPHRDGVQLHFQSFMLYDYLVQCIFQLIPCERIAFWVVQEDTFDKTIGNPMFSNIDHNAVTYVLPQYNNSTTHATGLSSGSSSSSVGSPVHSAQQGTPVPPIQLIPNNSLQFGSGPVGTPTAVGATLPQSSNPRATSPISGQSYTDKQLSGYDDYLRTSMTSIQLTNLTTGSTQYLSQGPLEANQSSTSMLLSNTQHNATTSSIFPSHASHFHQMSHAAQCHKAAQLLSDPTSIFARISGPTQNNTNSSTAAESTFTSMSPQQSILGLHQATMSVGLRDAISNPPNVSSVERERNWLELLLTSGYTNTARNYTTHLEKHRDRANVTNMPGAVSPPLSLVCMIGACHGQFGHRVRWGHGVVGHAAATGCPRRDIYNNTRTLMDVDLPPYYLRQTNGSQVLLPASALSTAKPGTIASTPEVTMSRQISLNKGSSPLQPSLLCSASPPNPTSAISSSSNTPTRNNNPQSPTSMVSSSSSSTQQTQFTPKHVLTIPIIEPSTGRVMAVVQLFNRIDTNMCKIAHHPPAIVNNFYFIPPMMQHNCTNLAAQSNLVQQHFLRHQQTINTHYFFHGHQHQSSHFFPTDYFILSALFPTITSLMCRNQSAISEDFTFKASYASTYWDSLANKRSFNSPVEPFREFAASAAAQLNCELVSFHLYDAHDSTLHQIATYDSNGSARVKPDLDLLLFSAQTLHCVNIRNASVQWKVGHPFQCPNTYNILTVPFVYTTNDSASFNNINNSVVSGSHPFNNINLTQQQRFLLNDDLATNSGSSNPPPNFNYTPQHNMNPHLHNNNNLPLAQAGSISRSSVHSGSQFVIVVQLINKRCDGLLYNSATRLRGAIFKQFTTLESQPTTTLVNNVPKQERAAAQKSKSNKDEKTATISSSTQAQQSQTLSQQRPPLPIVPTSLQRQHTLDLGLDANGNPTSQTARTLSQQQQSRGNVFSFNGVPPQTIANGRTAPTVRAATTDKTSPHQSTPSGSRPNHPLPGAGALGINNTYDVNYTSVNNNNINNNNLHNVPPNRLGSYDVEDDTCRDSFASSMCVDSSSNNVDMPTNLQHTGISSNNRSPLQTHVLLQTTSQPLPHALLSHNNPNPPGFGPTGPELPGGSQVCQTTPNYNGEHTLEPSMSIYHDDNLANVMTTHVPGHVLPPNIQTQTTTSTIPRHHSQQPTNPPQTLRGGSTGGGGGSIPSQQRVFTRSGSVVLLNNNYLNSTLVRDLSSATLYHDIYRQFDFLDLKLMALLGRWLLHLYRHTQSSLLAALSPNSDIFSDGMLQMYGGEAVNSQHTLIQLNKTSSMPNVGMNNHDVIEDEVQHFEALNAHASCGGLQSSHKLNVIANENNSNNFSERNPNENAFGSLTQTLRNGPHPTHTTPANATMKLDSINKQDLGLVQVSHSRAANRRNSLAMITHLPTHLTTAPTTANHHTPSQSNFVSLLKLNDPSVGAGTKSAKPLKSMDIKPSGGSTSRGDVIARRMSSSHVDSIASLSSSTQNNQPSSHPLTSMLILPPTQTSASNEIHNVSPHKPSPHHVSPPLLPQHVDGIPVIPGDNNHDFPFPHNVSQLDNQSINNTAAAPKSNIFTPLLVAPPGTKSNTEETPSKLLAPSQTGHFGLLSTPPHQSPINTEMLLFKTSSSNGHESENHNINNNDGPHDVDFFPPTTHKRHQDTQSQHPDIFPPLPKPSNIRTHHSSHRYCLNHNDATVPVYNYSQYIGANTAGQIPRMRVDLPQVNVLTNEITFGVNITPDLNNSFVDKVLPKQTILAQSPSSSSLLQSSMLPQNNHSETCCQPDTLSCTSSDQNNTNIYTILTSNRENTLNTTNIVPPGVSAVHTKVVFVAEFDPFSLPIPPHWNIAWPIPMFIEGVADQTQSSTSVSHNNNPNNYANIASLATMDGNMCPDDTYKMPLFEDDHITSTSAAGTALPTVNGDLPSQGQSSSSFKPINTPCTPVPLIPSISTSRFHFTNENGFKAGPGSTHLCGHPPALSTAPSSMNHTTISALQHQLQYNIQQHHIDTTQRYIASLFSPFSSVEAARMLSPQYLAKYSLDHFKISPMDCCVAIYNTFVSLGFLKLFKCHYTTLQSLILTICSLYRDNSFHNFKHAFSVFQFCYVLLVNTGVDSYTEKAKKHTLKNGNIRIEPIYTAVLPHERLHGKGWMLPRFEACLVMLSSLCHDIDHPGNTNLYEIQTYSRLALLHNNKSVLENHHTMVTMLLLLQPQLNIFHNLDRERQQYARKFMIECILATDMEHHFITIQKMVAINDINELALLHPYCDTTSQAANTTDDHDDLPLDPNNMQTSNQSKDVDTGGAIPHTKQELLQQESRRKSIVLTRQLAQSNESSFTDDSNPREPEVIILRETSFESIQEAEIAVDIIGGTNTRSPTPDSSPLPSLPQQQLTEDFSDVESENSSTARHTFNQLGDGRSPLLPQTPQHTAIKPSQLQLQHAQTPQLGSQFNTHTAVLRGVNNNDNQISYDNVCPPITASMNRQRAYSSANYQNLPSLDITGTHNRFEDSMPTAHEDDTTLMDSLSDRDGRRDIGNSPIDLVTQSFPTSPLLLDTPTNMDSNEEYRLSNNTRQDDDYIILTEEITSHQALIEMHNMNNITSSNAGGIAPGVSSSSSTAPPPKPDQSKKEKDWLFLAQLFIHAADICGQVLPLSIALAWEQCISEEFSQQGCNEIRQNIKPLPFLLDLNYLYTRCKGQVGFLSFVLIPWWQQLTRLMPSLNEFLRQTETNKLHYQSVVNQIDQYRQQRAALWQLEHGPAEPYIHVPKTKAPIPPSPPPPLEQYPPDAAHPLGVPCKHHGHWITIVPHQDITRYYTFYSQPVNDVDASFRAEQRAQFSEHLMAYNIPQHSASPDDHDPMDDLIDYDVTPLISQPPNNPSSSHRIDDDSVSTHGDTNNTPNRTQHAPSQFSLPDLTKVHPKPVHNLNDRFHATRFSTLWKCTQKLQPIPIVFNIEEHGE